MDVFHDAAQFALAHLDGIRLATGLQVFSTKRRANGIDVTVGQSAGRFDNGDDIRERLLALAEALQLGYIKQR